MPAVTSDKADYEPGAPVVLTGSGWQPGESVHIVVNDDGLQPEVWQHTATVVADAAGGFEYQFDLPDWLVANYTVTATGQLGHRVRGIHGRPRRSRLRCQPRRSWSTPRSTTSAERQRPVLAARGDRGVERAPRGH